MTNGALVPYAEFEGRAAKHSNQAIANDALLKLVGDEAHYCSL